MIDDRANVEVEAASPDNKEPAPDATAAEEASAMEKAQEDAAEERQDNGGYQ